MKEYQDYEAIYKEKYGNLVPLYQVMGNPILKIQFNNDTRELYKYCIDFNMKWEEVLDYKKQDGVDY